MLRVQCDVPVHCVWWYNYSLERNSNEIVIFHDINYTSQKPQTCNNGAIIGHVVRAENDSYMSQISDELNGTTVVCAHDNGTDSIEIGSAILDITTGIYVATAALNTLTFQLCC